MIVKSAKEAIKQAVDAGWEDEPCRNYIKFHEWRSFLFEDQMLMRLETWEAIGRARGWAQPVDEGENEWGKRICLHCGVDTATQPSLESGCNHVHYPEACKVCSLKKTDPKAMALEWFRVRLSKEDEQRYWETLP